MLLILYESKVNTISLRYKLYSLLFYAFLFFENFYRIITGIRMWKGCKIKKVVVKHLFNVKILKNNSIVYKLVAGVTLDI